MPVPLFGTDGIVPDTLGVTVPFTPGNWILGEMVYEPYWPPSSIFAEEVCPEEVAPGDGSHEAPPPVGHRRGGVGSQDFGSIAM